jgi:hypothetical protein
MEHKKSDLVDDADILSNPYQGFGIPLPLTELKYDAMHQHRHPKDRSSKNTAANVLKRRKANKAAKAARKVNRK